MKWNLFKCIFVQFLNFQKETKQKHQIAPS